jgi:hypothetical protein
MGCEVIWQSTKSFIKGKKNTICKKRNTRHFHFKFLDNNHTSINCWQQVWTLEMAVPLWYENTVNIFYHILPIIKGNGQWPNQM